MAIARKPVPGGAAPAQVPEEDPPGQFRRQDSWEVYSDDEDDEPTPAPHQPTGPAARPFPTEPSHGTTASSSSYMDEPKDRERPRTGTLDQVPDSLRPGGGRAQTNPFLRKKLPQETVVPPTEALSKMSTGDKKPDEWASVQRSGTVTSSNYGTPTGTSTSDANPWATNPVPHSYSPASDATLLQDESKSTTAASRLEPSHTGTNPWASPQTTAAQAPEHPPYLPPQPESNPWADSAPSVPPPQPPLTTSSWTAPATQKTDPATDPSEKPPLLAHPVPAGVPPPPAPGGEVEQSGNSQAQTATPHTTMSQSQSPAIMSVPSDDDSTWVDAGKEGDSATLPQPTSQAGQTLEAPADQDPWVGLESLDQPDKAKERAVDSQIGEWRLVDVGESSTAANADAPQGQPAEERQPELPPRPTSSGDARWVSPRPAVDAKTETYQVKAITWHDANSSQNPRESPILVQNANGPCPLVALVNALSLTTPPDVSDSSLVEILRSREQISLNLLLDAVFEELMSPRRTNSDAVLPDVGDLYAFLMSLHTGLNVNPRFIPSSGIRDAYDRTSLTHLDQSERASLIPGTFENTHEMALYATFRIPLIHGWLPPTSDPVYGALERQAQSYEDAQNLLFREEELENKLSDSGEGLTPQEQQMYQDIVTIKGFFESSATQLTAWGIEVISKAIRPGSFAILFRNDHFSTLYCHPQTKELVTVVTDEGYRTHKEVVWESLVDTDGRRTQHLSGDFRVVGTGESSTSGAYPGEESGEWTTVEGRRGRSQQQQQQHHDQRQHGPAAEPTMDAREQEDRDLALALQLQEEEDQRHREEEARRRREQDLSNQYIEQQGRQHYGNATSGSRASYGASGIAPARRSSNALHAPVTGPGAAGAQDGQATSTTPPRSPASSQRVRPLIPPRRSNAANRPANGGGDAPPPYELAAHDEPFEPPPGHPSHATSSSDVSHVSTNPGPGPGPSPGAGVGQPPRPGHIHRPLVHSASTRPPGGPYGAGGFRERERDCVVM